MIHEWMNEEEEPLSEVCDGAEEEGGGELLERDEHERVHAAVHGHLHQRHHHRRHHVQRHHHQHRHHPAARHRHHDQSINLSDKSGRPSKQANVSRLLFWRPRYEEEEGTRRRVDEDI